jgi:hypothetical protein
MAAYIIEMTVAAATQALAVDGPNVVSGLLKQVL